jgi:hypothetical protein
VLLRQQEERVAAVAPAPDPSAELRRSAGDLVRGHVSVFGRDVTPTRRSWSRRDVDLAAHERHHRILELVPRHPAVHDRAPRLGDERRHEPVDPVDRLDPVVDEEDLPAAPQLAHDVRADLPLVERRHLGRDRHPPLRRRRQR